MLTGLALALLALLGAPLFAIIGAGALLGFSRAGVDLTAVPIEIYGIAGRAEAATLEKRPGSLNELHGMLGFIDTIDVYNRSNSADVPSA